jgi:hypothetical protein
VNLFIAKNYFIADTFTSNERWRLLLQKKKNPAPVLFEKIKEEKLTFDAEIPVNGASCLKIDVGYNLKGKLKSFRYRAPRINIIFIKPDGEWRSFKTSPELLKAGIMVEKLVLTNKDFADFISQKDSLTTISKVKLQADTRYLSRRINVQYFRVAQ